MRKSGTRRKEEPHVQEVVGEEAHEEHEQHEEQGKREDEEKEGEAADAG